MISTGDHREQIQIGESVCLSDWVTICVCVYVYMYLLSICTALYMTLYMTAYIQSTFSKYLFESIKEFEFK